MLSVLQPYFQMRVKLDYATYPLSPGVNHNDTKLVSNGLISKLSLYILIKGCFVHNWKVLMQCYQLCNSADFCPISSNISSIADCDGNYPGLSVVIIQGLW